VAQSQSVPSTPRNADAPRLKRWLIPLAVSALPFVAIAAAVSGSTWALIPAGIWAALGALAWYSPLLGGYLLIAAALVGAIVAVLAGLLGGGEAGSWAISIFLVLLLAIWWSGLPFLSGFLFLRAGLSTGERTRRKRSRQQHFAPRGNASR
jgi:hypothetical protein